MIHTDTNRLMTIDEICTRYPFSKSWIRKACMDRRIPFVKIGKRVLFEPDAIDAFVAQHRQPVVEASA